MAYKINSDTIIMNNISRNRGGYNSLDILKLSLAYLVLLRHIGQSYFEDFSLFRMIITNTISPVAVPIFFTISGFLFFRKSPNTRKLGTQAARILILYLVWSIIYLPWTLQGYMKSGASLMECCIDYIQNALFNGTSYQLWYLPALIFALVAVYFLCRYLSTGKMMVLSCVLYFLGCMTDTYNFWFNGLQKLANNYRMVFVTTRNGLFFGVIFVFVGKLIADYEFLLKKHMKVFVVILGAAIVGLFYESYFLIEVQGKTVINMNLMSVPLSATIVTLAVLKRGKIQTERAVLFRRMSTIIFCIHPWIMYTLTFIIASINQNLNAYMKAGVVIIITTAISFVVVKMQDRITLLKYFF